MMKKRMAVLTALCLILVLAAVTGCGQQPSAEEPAAADTVPANACTVSLAGNATTGYSWKATEFDAEKLAVVALTYVQDEAEEGMTGVGGTYRFYIQPLAGVTGGEYDVVFHYLQDWEGGSDDGGVATVHVTVSADGTASCGEPVLTQP